MRKPLWSLAILFLAAQPVIVEAQDPAVFSAEPRKPAPGADELQKLLIARNNAALIELQARGQELMAGRVSVDEVVDAAVRWRDSALELSEKPADQMVIHQQTLEVARYLDTICDAKLNAGTIRVADVQKSHYFRLDAEIRLLKAKQKMEKPK